MVTVEVAAGQAPGAFVVRVNTTVPLEILGVYVEVSELGLEKLPLGAVQVELEAPPPIVPANVIVPPAQTDCAAPALAVAFGFTFTVLSEVAAVQPAGKLVVSLKVTVPVKLTAGV